MLELAGLILEGLGLLFQGFCLLLDLLSFLDFLGFFARLFRRA